MERVLNEICTLKNNEGAAYISFAPLERFKWLIQGFSTRLGGVSAGYLASLNLGFERGDDTACVDRNWELLGEAAGFDVDKLSFPNQWHTNNVSIAGSNTWARGSHPDKEGESIDGQITNVPGTVLVTYGADCTPVMLIDDSHKAIGQCHCGWKGTLNGISQVTIDMMGEQYGTIPSELVAVIGPSISRDRYEVEIDVAGPFIEKYEIVVNEASQIVKTGAKQGKYMLDLWEANRQNLVAVGVKTENIYVSGLCTYCESELMYSHRREGNRRGVMAAFMSIKS